MAYRSATLLVTLLALACLGACSPSTVFVSSYRPPTAEPLAMKGERVAAMVLMADPARRDHAEDLLAREITKQGAVGVPMHQIYATEGGVAGDEAAARAALEAAGVKGVIAMRPRRAKKEVVTPPQTYNTPMYSGFWGGYYPYCWGPTTWSAADGPYRASHGVQTVDPYVQYANMDHTVVDPGGVEIYDVIRVEIVIYSLKQNQLVWAGESETVDPSDVESFVEELTEGTAEQLRQQYLIPG